MEVSKYNKFDYDSVSYRQPVVGQLQSEPHSLLSAKFSNSDKSVFGISTNKVATSSLKFNSSILNPP